MAEPTSGDRTRNEPTRQVSTRPVSTRPVSTRPASAAPWSSGQRPSPIPTHYDVNRPAPRRQGVFGWSILAWLVVIAILGVLFKWSLAGG